MTGDAQGEWNPFLPFLFENINSMQIEIKKNSSCVTLRNSFFFVVVTHSGTILTRMQFVGMSRPVWGENWNLCGMFTHSWDQRFFFPPQRSLFLLKDSLLVQAWGRKSQISHPDWGHLEIALKESNGWCSMIYISFLNLNFAQKGAERRPDLEKGWDDDGL